MMNGERLRIVEVNDTTRIEIPSVDERWASVPCFAAGLVTAGVFISLLSKTTVLVLLFSLIWAVASAVFVLLGFENWQWSKRGLEVFEVSPQQLLYRREGAPFSKKQMRIEGEKIDVQVLWLCIGGNRLEVSARHRRVFCGRGISRTEAKMLRELLLKRFFAEWSPDEA
jgi:hypothetical protein